MLVTLEDIHKKFWKKKYLDVYTDGFTGLTETFFCLYEKWLNDSNGGLTQQLVVW